jgi:hypothetical protein
VKVPHKVVYPVDEHKRPEGRKFITIYAGPLMYSSLALVNRLDPLLVEMEARSSAG